jgi:MHS family proline/betaine transporter-like MFS transporter
VVAWGWRIPFFIGLLIAPVGLYLRRTLDETPEFQAEMARRRGVARAQGAPLLLAFRDHWRALLKGLGLCVLWAVGPYTLIIPMPAYAQSVLHYSGPQSFASALISDVVLALTCFAAGALSDRIGRRKVLAASAVLVFIGAAPLFFWLQQSHHMITLVTVQCSFCLIVGLYLGVAPAALAELFATNIRASGMALTYTTAVVALGAFAPAIMAGLSSTLGAAALAPAWYVTAAAVASLIAIGFLPSRTPVDD